MKITDKIVSLKGIGPKTAALFEKLKVYTIEDLIKLYPRNYLSYAKPVAISEAEPGERVTIKASVQSYVDIKKVRSLTLVTCIVKDGTGVVKLTWYNSPFLKQVFHIGQTFIFVGTLIVRNHQLTMEHPEYYTQAQYDKLVSSLQPVYPLTEGLSNKVVTKAVAGALVYLDEITDKVPEEIRKSFSLMPLDKAIQGTHFPDNMDTLMECRNRLVFDEFFWFLLHMRLMREKTVKARNHFVMKDYSAVDAFIERLPFSLTKGQAQAIREIEEDMSGDTVMNRLIQGDVGSGKTAVAEMALLAAVKNGYQAAFMAPTEVLAMQHFESISRDLGDFDIRVELLCGSTRLSEKRRIYEALAALSLIHISEPTRPY